MQQRIRQQARGRDVLMITLTGWGHLVTKPVDFETIAILFRRHLAETRA